MPSTHLCLHYHLVFSTKARETSIDPTWRSRLHQYLGGTVNNLEGISKGVGGTSDHVHLLVELRATHTLADFMRDLKRGTSTWIHDEISLKDFAWQEGYAAFTVSPSAIDKFVAILKTKKNIIANGPSAKNWSLCSNARV